MLYLYDFLKQEKIFEDVINSLVVRESDWFEKHLRESFKFEIENKADIISKPLFYVSVDSIKAPESCEIRGELYYSKSDDKYLLSVCVKNNLNDDVNNFIAVYDENFEECSLKYDFKENEKDGYGVFSKYWSDIFDRFEIVRKDEEDSIVFKITMEDIKNEIINKFGEEQYNDLLNSYGFDYLCGYFSHNLNLEFDVEVETLVDNL